MFKRWQSIILHAFIILIGLSIAVLCAVFVQEDPVLLVPEAENQKPYVAIIKVIAISITLLVYKWFFEVFPDCICG